MITGLSRGHCPEGHYEARKINLFFLRWFPGGNNFIFHQTKPNYYLDLKLLWLVGGLGSGRPRVTDPEQARGVIEGVTTFVFFYFFKKNFFENNFLRENSPLWPRSSKWAVAPGQGDRDAQAAQAKGKGDQLGFNHFIRKTNPMGTLLGRSQNLTRERRLVRVPGKRF